MSPDSGSDGGEEANSTSSAPALARYVDNHDRELDVNFREFSGVYYAHVAGLPVVGEDLSLAVGVYRSWSGSLEVQVEDGRTEHGLKLRGFHTGVSLERIVGHLRLGGEVRFGYLQIERVTRLGWISGLSTGLMAHASFDLVTTNGTDSLFLRVSYRADSYGDTSASGPAVALGYRWDSLLHVNE